MTLTDIELRRETLGLSRYALAMAAGVRPETYQGIVRHGRKPQQRTLARLVMALDQLQLRGMPVPARAAKRHPDKKLLISTYRGFVLAICRHFNADAAAVLAADKNQSRGRDADWVLAAKVRSLAVYCLTIEFDLAGAHVARALGITKQTVSAMLHRVEDYREDPQIDALLDDTAALLAGHLQDCQEGDG